MIHRRPAVKFLLEDRPANVLAVTGLATSIWDLAAAGDDRRNFSLIGAMGQAAPFALGLAMAQPEKRVWLFTGDGELLMALGVLATIANRAPANLAIVVLDNETYAETGGQETATAGLTNLELIARGAGIANSSTITEESELPALRTLLRSANGPLFVNVKVFAEPLPVVFPHTFDGATAINRFRDAAIS